MKKNRLALIGCLVISLLSLYLLLPTIWNLWRPDRADQFPSWMPKSAMRLGLDLQGGIHMVMGVDLDKVAQEQLKAYGHSLEKSLDDDGIKGVKTTVLNDKFELEVVCPDPATKAKVVEKITKSFQVLEFVGESGDILVTRMNRTQEDFVRTHALDQSIETIRNRIDEFGVSEPIITKKGTSQILVQFPGAKEPERVKELIGQTAQLNFQMVHECQDGGCLARWQADMDAKIKAAEAKGNYTRDSFKRLSEYVNRLNVDLKSQMPPDTTLAFEKAKDINVKNNIRLIPFVLSTRNMVSGQYIEDANVDVAGGGGGRNSLQMNVQRPAVAFRMNAVGTPLFAKMTTDYRGYYMAIVLDGIVRSAPVIQSAITEGRGQISLGNGNLDEVNKEARDTSIVLRAGALPASIEVQEERIIGPSMGRDAIEAGKKSLIISGVLVFIFMWVYYGMAGLLSNFVTLINVSMIFAVLGAMGATLTLPGIAGIVLTIGMAVDALIIIFERMREERRRGRNTRQMVEIGFDKAFSAILDSNVSTAIGGAVLLQYGTGSIRGFALTLIVGVVANVFMSSFFMHTLFKLWLEDADANIGMGMSKKEIAEGNA